MLAAAGALIFNGMTAAPGFARGPFVRTDPRQVSFRKPGNSHQEESALRAALAVTNGQIAALASAMGGDAAEILEFQLALLEDESLLEPVFDAIAGGASADRAWSQVLAEQIADYR